MGIHVSMYPMSIPGTLMMNTHRSHDDLILKKRRYIVTRLFKW